MFILYLIYYIEKTKNFIYRFSKYTIPLTIYNVIISGKLYNNI